MMAEAAKFQSPNPRKRKRAIRPKNFSLAPNVNTTDEAAESQLGDELDLRLESGAPAEDSNALTPPYDDNEVDYNDEEEDTREEGADKEVKKTLLHITLMGLWGMIAERGRTPAPIVAVHLKIKELQAAIRDYEENLLGLQPAVKKIKVENQGLIKAVAVKEPEPSAPKRVTGTEPIRSEPIRTGPSRSDPN